MRKKVRHHRTHLYPYDIINRPLSTLPSIVPSPSLIVSLPSRHYQPALRKVRLVPISPPHLFMWSVVDKT